MPTNPYTDPNFDYSGYGEGGDPNAIPTFDPSSIPGSYGDPSQDWMYSPGMVPGYGFDPSMGQPDLSGGSFISKLLGNPQGLADAASMFGGLSSGEKSNRYLKGNLTQGYDQLMMGAERNRNANESDALRKLNQTSYIMGGGSHFKPPTIQLNGQSRTAPDLGFGPPPISDAQRQGASTLQDQLTKRLSPGGSYTPQPLSGYADPGIMERIGDYGALGAGGLGAIGTIAPQQGGNAIGNILGGVGKGLGAAKSAMDFFKMFGG